MLSPTGPEIAVLVLLLLVAIAILVAIYWLVRLAVRHGVRDAERKPPEASTTSD